MKPVLLVLVLASCGGSVEHARVPYRNGNLAVEFDRIDGEKEGAVRFFDHDGHITTVGNYLHDRKHGYQYTLDERGDTLVSLRYVRGKKDGYQCYRSSNGQLLRLERFDHGVPDGPMLLLFPDGAPREVIRYDHGITTGMHYRWWRSDTLDGCFIEGRFENGTNNGIWRTRFGNGHKSSEGLYIHSVPHGIWRWWDRDGKVVEEKEYDHGTVVRTIVKREPRE